MFPTLPFLADAAAFWLQHSARSTPHLIGSWPTQCGGYIFIQFEDEALIATPVLAFHEVP